jgi:hypothetical protein
MKYILKNTSLYSAALSDTPHDAYAQYVDDEGGKSKISLKCQSDYDKANYAFYR